MPVTFSDEKEKEKEGKEKQPQPNDKERESEVSVKASGSPLPRSRSNLQAMVADEVLAEAESTLCRDRTHVGRRFKKCFIGTEFVDFLLMKGVAKDRRQGETIGKALFDAGNVTHVQDEHGFRDKAYYYKFIRNQTWEVPLEALRKCNEDIGKEHTSGLKSYPNTFTGADFILWLLENDVAGDRAEAEATGKELFEAGQLQHIQNQHKFKDDKTLLYKLVLPIETADEKKKRKEDEEKSRHLAFVGGDWATSAEQGVLFLKHGRNGKPHKKRIKVDRNGRVEWGTGSCNLLDAEDISPGKNTKLFQKVEHKVADPRVCFSIVLPNRSLDLQARSEEERDFWVKGLRELQAKLLEDAEVENPNGGASSTSGSMSGGSGGSGSGSGSGGNGGSGSGASATAAIAASVAASINNPIDSPVMKAPEQRIKAAVRFEKDAWSATASQGVKFLKHGRHGKPHDRLIKVDPQRGTLFWETGSLNLKDALDIVKGKQTKTLIGVKHSEAAPAVCFSIIMPNRSLDLQAADQTSRDQWVQGLRELKGKFDPQWQMRRASFRPASSALDDEEDWNKEWKQAKEGTLMLKHGRHGKPHNRLVKVSEEGELTWETGNLDLKDVVDVAPGKTTKLFQATKDTIADPKVCFSVLMPKDRHLNLQCNSEQERDLWVKGLRLVKGQLDPKWKQRRRSWIQQQREEAYRKQREDESKVEAEVRVLANAEKEMLPLHLIDQLTLELGQMGDFETLASQLGCSLLPPPPPAPGDPPAGAKEPVFSEEGNSLAGTPEEWAEFERQFEAQVRAEIEESFRKTIVAKRQEREQMKADVGELRVEVEKRMETLISLKAEMRGVLTLHTELRAEHDKLATALEPLKQENASLRATLQGASRESR